MNGKLNMHNKIANFGFALVRFNQNRERSAQQLSYSAFAGEMNAAKRKVQWMEEKHEMARHTRNAAQNACTSFRPNQFELIATIKEQTDRQT